jgi:protoporphyrin/coproporphyrin ferrochelatase
MPYYRAVPQEAALPTRIGVLMVNLGTPDAPSYFAVQRYLREFLSDRRVIETARAIWLPLLYGVVLPFRPLKTVRNYRKIWLPEGSPLAVYSRRLAENTGRVLRSRPGQELRVALGMSYGNPSIASAIQSLKEQSVTRLLVLPLYPQYCASTSGSVFDGTTAVLRRWRWLPETRFVNDYHDDPGYIDALASSVEGHWRRRGERSHLLFSYHGIPASYVKDGDPYQRQAEGTTRAVVARLELRADAWSHSYQSRFGRVEWLKPYTVDMLRTLTQRGVRRLTVVSPSFAVDCLETLEEIAIEYRDVFLSLGGEELSLVPALNDGDDHARLLAAVVERHLGGWL